MTNYFDLSSSFIIHKQKNNVPIETPKDDDEPNFIVIFYMLWKIRR
jgi:hypothetical protein